MGEKASSERSVEQERVCVVIMKHEGHCQESALARGSAYY